KGAMSVFAEAGYGGAGIDAIAKRAGVSTRTIYNHFQDKPELFHATIMESTTSVTAAMLAVVERHFRKVTDLEADLIAFGCDLVRTKAEFAAHFEMMRQVKTEWSHVPAEAARQWDEAGPRRFNTELAARLRLLAERGLLRVGDADQAAHHLLVLAWSGLPDAFELGGTPDSEVVEKVTAGVQVFLYGYAGGPR
ncbi:MAG: TetR/AcrR family transcriptional regulator, partial [Stackebrandtia sp.]